MILEGNERGGAKNLALHLLKDENDHVNVHELRGFMSDDLVPALNEIYAISQGTKARKFMFSLSPNPPQTERVSTQAFLSAIERIEKDLGLSSQPRAIVFYEKNGRRHCHVVWSRIDAVEMKAIKIDYYKRKLMDISRDLYMEHGWKMPRGFMNFAERDPKNFKLAQWQQARRAGKHSRDVKAAFQDCSAVSDSVASFGHALTERGYMLAVGRRGYVTINECCEVYSVPRQLRKGTNNKDVIAKLGEPKGLPTVEQAKAAMAAALAKRLQALSREQHAAIAQRQQDIKKLLVDLVQRQTSERQTLDSEHAQRNIRESKARQARYSKGLRGLLDHFTGKHRRIREQNERDALAALERDRREMDALIFAHLNQRRSLSRRMDRLEQLREASAEKIKADIGQFQDIREGRQDVLDRISSSNERGRASPSLGR
ncbi:MAG: relaxase [Pseudomonadota bacterium]